MAETMEVDIQSKIECKEEYNHVAYPAKQHVAQLGRPVETLVNFFPLKLKDTKIYKYAVLMEKVTDRKTQDLSRGPKGSFARQHRIRVNLGIFRAVFKKLQKENDAYKALGKDQFVFDSGNIMYSVVDLGELVETELPFEEITSESAQNHLGRSCKHVSVRIQRTIDFVLNDFILSEEQNKQREALQCLEVITTANVHKSGDFFSFGNKHYGKSSRNGQDLGGARIVKSGAEKNCRIVCVGNKPVPVIQVDAKKSPFFTGGPLVDTIQQMVGRDISRLIQDRAQMKRVTTQLKGLAVKTTHLPREKKFFISGIASKSARDHKFTDQNGNLLTVADYFEEKYKMRLRHADLPLIIEKCPGKENFFPMEVLELEKGQLVTSEKSTRDIAEKMIKMCQQLPAQMQNYVLDMCGELELDVDNDVLKAFGVSIRAKDWEFGEGRQLDPPALQYAGRESRPNDRGWRVDGQLYTPATISNIMLLSLDGALRGRDIDQFLGNFIDQGKRMGVRMQVSNRDVDVREMSAEQEESIEEMFEEAAKKNVSIILVITREKFDPVHGFIKAMEAKHGVVTQHISGQTASKAIQRNNMVLTNLFLKTNVKTGGTNHMISPQAGGRSSKDNLLHQSRMFIGLDVSHAGPQSFADRATKASSEPTVVAMTYSLNCATQLGGRYWCQEPRLACISDLNIHIAEALKHRKSATRNLPQELVVFRGGVSEGEFGKVVDEMNLIREACRAFEPNYDPTISCLVVQANSNYRVIPTRINLNDRAPQQNLQPGTILDNELTSPVFSEFVLVAQRALQGTARPTRCTLVFEHKGAIGTPPTLRDLEQLTFALCHGHQASTTPTTLPAPLRAATDLSKRGRSNFKTMNHMGNDRMSIISGSSGGGRIHSDGQDPEYFQKLSKDVSSRLTNHFWA